LLGLPLFVWLTVGPGAYGRALLVLAVVAATDWVDGYVARRFDQVTRLGRIMDPLIDRIMLATAGLTLLAVGFIPLVVVGAIVVRDVAILVGSLVRFGGIPPIPVSRAGKFATACLLIGVPGFLLGNMDWALADVAGVLARGFTVVGVVAYYVAGAQYARAAAAVRGRQEPEATG
jgi:cardiolipin synthase (CMP-forming)